MDISLLKTFIEVYQLRHFRKAADKLCITQSAVSARIKLLEDKLGARLFYRERGAIEPSPAGHRFFRHAQQMVSSWEQARQTVGLPEHFAEQLSIGFIADIWHMFLNSCIDAVRTEMPQLALNLTIYSGHTIHERLISRSLDLGFVFEPLKLSALTTEQVRSVSLKLFSTRRGVSLEQALNENYILVDWGAAFSYDHSQHFSDTPSVSLKTNYGVMALDMLKQSGGAAYFPPGVAQAYDEALPLYEVAGAPEFNREIYAVYRRDSGAGESIEEVIDIVNRYR